MPSERQPSEETVVSIIVSNCCRVLWYWDWWRWTHSVVKCYRKDVVEKYLETGFLILSAFWRKLSVSLPVSYQSCIGVNWLKIILSNISRSRILGFVISWDSKRLYSPWSEIQTKGKWEWLEGAHSVKPKESVCLGRALWLPPMSVLLPRHGHRQCFSLARRRRGLA